MASVAAAAAAENKVYEVGLRWGSSMDLHHEI